MNTKAIKKPELIKEASRIYGSQCIVGSIEAKRKGNSWEAYIDNGREQTGIDAIEWATKLEELGIGELCITSIDKDGTKKGFDIELVQKICEKVNLPVIVSGGAGNTKHISDLCKQKGVSAVAVASMLHYNLVSVDQIKIAMREDGINVRL